MLYTTNFTAPAPFPLLCGRAGRIEHSIVPPMVPVLTSSVMASFAHKSIRPASVKSESVLAESPCGSCPMTLRALYSRVNISSPHGKSIGGIGTDLCVVLGPVNKIIASAKRKPTPESLIS